MLHPNFKYVKINTKDELIALRRRLKFTLKKQLYYKGNYTDETTECNIVGYKKTDGGFVSILVIEINGLLHCINPMYLKHMQNKDFDRLKVLSAVPDEEDEKKIYGPDGDDIFSSFYNEKLYMKFLNKKKKRD